MITTIKDIVDFYNQFPEEIGNMLVNSRNGYKEIEFADITAFDSDIIQIKTIDGKSIETSPDHLLWCNNLWMKVKDIKLGDMLATIDGEKEVVSIGKLNEQEDLYDLQVEDHEFYANGIVSHNSTLLDAVTFSLYGKPFRKINKPQLVNSVNKSDLLTEIDFDINDISYKIIRGIKPNIFEIYENNVLIDQDSRIKDYQDYLESNILHMNYKAFTQIVIVGNATYTPFMRLSAADRRSIVESFLDIDIFTKMNLKLKEIISETKQKINDLTWKHDLNSEKLSMLEKVLQQSKDNTTQKIKDNDKEISVLSTKINVKKQKIQTIKQEIQNITYSNDKINKLEKMISKINEYSVIFKEKKKEANKYIDFLSKNDNCPTCKQIIEETHKVNSINERLVLIKDMEDGLSKSTLKIKDIQSELQLQLNNINLYKDKQSSIESINRDVEYIQKEIERIQKDNKKLLEESTSSLNQEKEQYNLLLEEKENLKKERDEIIEIQHSQAIATILLKDDGIKTKIIRYYLPTINKIINKYLQKMDFFVSFNLNENFDEEIKHAAKEDFSYNSFSEGEKLRIDLAMLFTWRELSKIRNTSSTNLLILDEVFDSSLDASGVDDFVRILLETIAKDTNTFIISHKGDTLIDKFENIIKFEKVKGFSKIING